MRVLTNVQIYQGGSIKGLSALHSVQDMIDSWTRIRDDIFVYVLLPKRTEESPRWKYDGSVLPNPKSAILEAKPFGALTGETDITPMVAMMLSPDEARLHYPKMINWYYDVCLDSRIYHLPHLKLAVNHRVTNKWFYTPVVANPHDVIIPEKMIHYNEGMAMLELYNLLQADDIIFYTKNDRDKLARENASRWATPAQVRWLLEKPYSLAPMNFDEIDKHSKEFQQKRDSREILSTGWFSSFWPKKKHVEIIQIYDKLHARYGIRGVVSTIKKKVPDELKQDWIDVHTDCGRSEYIPYLWDSDIVIVGSQHETTGRSYWEALIAGNVLVFKREPWLVDYLPNWYPYVGETWDEVEEIAFYVVNNIDVARKEAKKLEIHIRDIVNSDKSSALLLDSFDKVIPIKPSNMDTQIGELIQKSVSDTSKRKEKFSLEDVNLTTASHTKNGRPILESKFVFPKMIARYIEGMGYEDTCDSVIPYFRRR